MLPCWTQDLATVLVVFGMMADPSIHRFSQLRQEKCGYLLDVSSNAWRALLTQYYS